jgi:hypothetical protein
LIRTVALFPDRRLQPLTRVSTSSSIRDRPSHHSIDSVARSLVFVVPVGLLSE